MVEQEKTMEYRNFYNHYQKVSDKRFKKIKQTKNRSRDRKYK